MASGKARFAIGNFASLDYVLYLRAGEDLDPDITQRVDYSTKKNGVERNVVHKQTLTPADEVKDHKFVIFDSLSAYARLVMEDMCKSEDEITPELKKQIEKRVIDGITALQDKVTENHGNLIIISLETGFSVRPTDRALAAYRDIMGRVNQRITSTCAEVYFSASGIQFRIK